MVILETKVIKAVSNSRKSNGWLSMRQETLNITFESGGNSVKYMFLLKKE